MRSFATWNPEPCEPGPLVSQVLRAGPIALLLPGLAAIVLASIASLLPAQAGPGPTRNSSATVEDPSTRAAHACGEPGLGEIAAHLGYQLNPARDEVPAQTFHKAGRGSVVFRPIAAFGLPAVLTAGWYAPHGDHPGRKTLWQIPALDNKRYSPPIERGGMVTFDPGKHRFGLWVSTAGFNNETVSSEDDLQRFVPRFSAHDRHKAHVFPAVKDGHAVPHTYIVGWEYSTNNDNQDVVTLISNIDPDPHP